MRGAVVSDTYARTCWDVDHAQRRGDVASGSTVAKEGQYGSCGSEGPAEAEADAEAAGTLLGDADADEGGATAEDDGRAEDEGGGGTLGTGGREP